MALYVDYVLDMSDLPDECIDDMGGPGQKDEAIAYWRQKLDFTVNRDRAVECLLGYGAWDVDELNAMSDDMIAEHILWLAASNFAEWKASPDGEQGSDIFVLE